MEVKKAEMVKIGSVAHVLTNFESLRGSIDKPSWESLNKGCFFRESAQKDVL
jgi:hypothetical protein